MSLGLDISDLKLRAIELKKRFGKVGIASYEEIDVPQGYIVDGLIKEKEKVVKLIKKLKISQKKVVACLPEKQSFIKVIQPKNTDKDSIIKEAKKHLPFELDKVYLDFKVLREDSVLIGASKKKLVNNYLEVFKQADLKPQALVIESEAIARCLLTKDSPPCLIADLGLARTTLVIYYDKVIQFTTSFPSVIRGGKLDLQKAAEEILKVNSFCQGHLKEKFCPRNIILCGSGAHFKKVDKNLSKVIKMPVYLVDPWINLTNKRFRGKIKNSLAYTTAIGLALFK